MAVKVNQEMACYAHIEFPVVHFGDDRISRPINFLNGLVALCKYFEGMDKEVMVKTLMLCEDIVKSA